MYLYILHYTNKIFVSSNFQYHKLFIFHEIVFFYLGFPMSYKTLGITLVSQFQRVHILLGIALIISNYCRSHLTSNVIFKNFSTNKTFR